jgi:dTDP-4-amino-4,6-dideoxygalactose transaminase
MKDRIYLSSPHMGRDEQKFVEEAFSTNWVSPMGENIDFFEKAISNFTGAKAAVALSSGTAAIHLALSILGVSRGDEVLCSSFTFVASANPIVYLGAKPIFVDSESETWNMSPDLLEEAIIDRISQGKKPKAIMLVHLYGVPAKMDELMTIAAKYDIPVIEDAAEALGSTYNGKQLGTFGDIGIYSFNGNKIITTSGGGALVSNNKKYVERAEYLATQARDDKPYYQHSEIGYNYRMSNICAGIGRGQMKVLNERVQQRRANYNYYRENLSEFPEIQFVDEPKGGFSNRWLTCITIDGDFGRNSIEELRTLLARDEIESRPLWKPMHLQPIFEDCPFYGDGTSDKLFLKGLCLPSGSNLSLEDLNRVIDWVKIFVEKKYSKKAV